MDKTGTVLLPALCLTENLLPPPPRPTTTLGLGFPIQKWDLGNIPQFRHPKSLDPSLQETEGDSGQPMRGPAEGRAVCQLPVT